MQTGNVRVTLARALEPWVTATAANPAWHRAPSMQDGLVHSQVTQKVACPCNSFTQKAGVWIPPPPRNDPSPTPDLDYAQDGQLRDRTQLFTQTEPLLA